jgi:hypothetical protein
LKTLTKDFLNSKFERKKVDYYVVAEQFKNLNCGLEFDCKTVEKFSLEFRKKKQIEIRKSKENSQVFYLTKIKKMNSTFHKLLMKRNLRKKLPTK